MSTQSLNWAKENILTLTESEAMELVHYLRHRFQWVVTIWTPNDVLVTDEDSNELGAPTPAEREALANTWEWRKGIDEAQVTYTNEYMMPVITRHPDGSFTIHVVDESEEYNADGTPKNEHS